MRRFLMTFQHILGEEFEEYHPSPEDKPCNIIEGIYNVRNVDFRVSKSYGEVANIDALEGQFYTFSTVLIRQLKVAVQRKKLPFQISVKRVDKYLTLI